MAVFGTVPIPEVVTKPERLRQTLLAQLDKCPHSAFLNLKHDGGNETHPLYRGRAFHETIERCIRACLANGEVSVDQHHAKAVLQEVLMDHPEWVVPADELDDLRMMVFHWAETFECPIPALVEQLFTLEVDGETVSGTIDLLWIDGDTLHIRDWKTGAHVPPQGEISGKDPNTGEPKGCKNPQLIIYTLLALDGKPVDSDWKLPGGVNKVDARLVYPYFRWDDGLAYRGVVIERPELIEHRDWLRVLVNRARLGFERGEWPAVSGWHCRRCPSPQECPIPPELRQVQGLSPWERDASELAEELFFMQADVKRRTAELKGYVQRVGPVEFGEDMEASHKTVNTDPPSTRFGLHKRGTGH